MKAKIAMAIRTLTILTAAGILPFTLVTATAAAQTSQDPLKNGFEQPPESARPRVWWHWMNGNISKEGIKEDLEWMHRVGIGGYQNFDAALNTPQVVQKRFAYMTPEWKDSFKYATSLGHELGFEEAIAGSPGWSESGGPWVPPAHGMKKYVWSETRVEGGKPFEGVLAKPPSITGPFQNIPIRPNPNRPASTDKPFQPPSDFYVDSAVIAYRLPDDDVPIDSLHPKITTSGGTLDPNVLSDGDYSKAADLPAAPVGEKAWIQYEFDQPHAIRAVTLAVIGGGGFRGRGVGDSVRALEASDDGQQFHTVAPIPYAPIGATVSFAPVTARFFRVTFLTAPPPQVELRPGFNETQPEPVKVHHIAELVLDPGARVNRFEVKSAFALVPDLYEFATPDIEPAQAIRKTDVVDLTSRMKSDGTLQWTPPAGRWVILRMGFSLMGITNHPATPEATGLEVDKLNRQDVKEYIDKYLDSYQSFLGPLFGKGGLGYIINDSWEAGAQNWTDDIIAEFTRRRSYDPRPWMPVLTGHVVESAGASDQFLWDFRKTIADLTAENHYAQLQDSIKARGLGHYGESHEVGRAIIADGMEVKKMNDVPMSAMWTQQPGVNKETFGYNADDRESASVAHIYGQNLAAAESMTAALAPWAWSPATLKPTADQEFLNGINRIVIHESAHQPLVGKGTAPGLTLGPFGQSFNRNDTWAEQAGPWIDYLARTSYLLQQGHFAADIVYFYGEDSNLTAIFANKAPNTPPGYGFDYVNADALMHELRVSSGKITTQSGMSYRVLALDPYSSHMSLPVLRSIHKLVEDGAVIAGEKPKDTPSLADDATEFKRLNDELFGNGTGVHSVGNGKVYAGQDAEAALKALELAPDFDYSKSQSDQQILFVHRKLADGDLYFLDNRGDKDANVDASFRITGKAPEFWHAETGLAEPASYSATEGRTTVPLKLEPWGTVFVVFRHPTKAASRSLPKEVESQLATVEGPWTVSFQPDRGAPPSITLEKLTAWNESADQGVKYFSGTATYTNSFQVQTDCCSAAHKVWIDLGDVKNLAEVLVNGKSLGVVWHAPFRVNATAAMKPGKNEIIVRVTNAWVNRLIGDQQPDATTKYTFADVKPYKADSPLLPSGLLGPVVVIRQAPKNDDARSK